MKPLLIVALALGLVGCSTPYDPILYALSEWGGEGPAVIQDPAPDDAGLQILDRQFENPERSQAVAQAHCAQYDRTAEMRYFLPSLFFVTSAWRCVPYAEPIAGSPANN